MNNKETYKSFCIDNDDIPIFHQPWWLDIVAKDEWDIAISSDKNGNIKAVMPYSISRKMGMTVSLQPMLTPYLGILLFYPKDISKQTSIYSFQNKHISNIVKKLPQNAVYQYYNFIPEFDNWYPFFKNSYEQSIRYTYILHNIKDHNSIYDGFSNTLKRQIKEAESKIVISEESNVCLVFDLVKESFVKQKVKFAISRSFLKTVEKKIKEKKQGKVFVASDKDGNVNSAILLVWDTKQAYLLGLGTAQEYADNNSTKVLIWEGIKYASKFVDMFNFEGSMLSGVERLYRSYGGIRTPYFEIKKYKNRFYKALFAILNK